MFFGGWLSAYTVVVWELLHSGMVTRGRVRGVEGREENGDSNALSANVEKEGGCQDSIYGCVVVGRLT